MSKTLARIITTHPRRVLAVLAIVTLGLAAGSGLMVDQAGNSVFLPDDSDVAIADDTLSESFPDSAGLVSATVVHRGDVLSPEGLAHIDAVTAAALAEAEVAERLALTEPVVSLAGVFRQAIDTNDLASVSQEQIDAVAADPAVAPVVASLTGEADGVGVAISQIRLRQLGDAAALADVELLVADLVADVEGPLEVSAISPATIEDESAEALASSMAVLMLIALAVIAVLLAVFFRTGSDVVLSLAGLGITIVGTLGFQGLMGPDGLGVIGAPNRLTTMVPVMLIGLVVDYSIQSVARYRELRIDGLDVATAARVGLRAVMLPLGLAAITTVISFLTNVTSPIPANIDFGIVAAFGVAFGLATMLVLIPAARTILDTRRDARGTLGPVKPMADAIPGAASLAERIGRVVASTPAPVLIAAGLLTLGLGVAASQIGTEFDANDFLPTNGDSFTDIDTLDQALGGQTEVATILVEAELTDDRTLRNLFTVDQAFSDDLSRPTGAASDIRFSLGTLFEDWSTDSGQPGDKYDPELAGMVEEIDLGLTVDADGVQRILDRLAENDPQTFAQVAVNNPDGIDRTLLQFDAVTGDQDRTAEMVDDIEGLWFGDRDQVTTTSGEVIGLEVTTAMTDSQTSSIVATIVAALIVLMLFFWLTEFRPMLAVIAVLPIVLVLIWVLGTMTLLGIPYNVVTALITALSIGIGVDYTIHIIHRFTEEIHEGRSLAEATRVTLGTTGSALVGSALTTALAFAVLLFSPLVPFRQFGLVTGITILYALIAAVVVVPPMLVMWAAYHQWRAIGEGGSAHHGSGHAADAGSEAP